MRGQNGRVWQASRRRLLGYGVGLGVAAALGRRAPVVRAQDGTATVGDDEARAIVGDVVDFTLTPDGRWEGPFGSVTLRLHLGFYEGADAWFIRTDASDEAFADAEGLVYVPLLENALKAEGSYADIYLFDGGVDEQRPVISTTPGRDDFTSAFRVHTVSFAGEPTLLDRVGAIEAARAAGEVAVEATDIVVNYPLVSWPRGGLAADTTLEQPLGEGPLVAPPDFENGTVTFKLHQCYPGSRYIATDTSAVPMAPMMGITAAAPTQALIEAGATAPIYVFGNGFAGPGPMGFQPSVFNSTAGDVVWSPFWEHFTVVWKDEAAARVLKSEEEVLAAVEAGELDLFSGTPDTHPNGFVVNCPSPVLAPNSYEPPT